MTDWFADLRPFEAAYSAWKLGNYADDGRFLLKYEKNTPFSIAAGAGILVNEMRRFKLNSPEIVQKLGSHRDKSGKMAFDESFLNHLQRMRFRGRILAATEGTLLLPGEPVLIVEAGLLQGLLLKYILDTTIWKSTHYATQAALKTWELGKFQDKKTVAPPNFSDDENGWKTRALFIGSGDENLDFSEKISVEKKSGYQLESPENPIAGYKNGLAQIRRCFQSSEPVADIWLTDEQEEKQPGGLRSHTFLDENNEKTAKTIKFSRFQNIYQPVIWDGHTAFASPKLAYLRQRTLRQLESFQEKGTEKMPFGWLEK